MDEDWVGRACALLAALTWAGALVLFKRSGERVPPLALNLFKNTIALILLALTLVVTRDGFETLQPFQPADLAILTISGFLGIALADTAFFMALNRIGVGRVSIVECLYSPLVVLFAFFLLSERITTAHYVGAGFIVAAVFISSRHDSAVPRARGQVVVGVVLGAVSMALMALGIVIAKPVLDVLRFPLIWATTLRLLAGTAALAAMALASPQRRAYWAVFRPSPAWKTSVPASVLGSYLAMIFWVGGFKYTQTSVAAILNQTSIVFAIILASVVLKERFTRRKLIAVMLAVTGIATVTFPFG